MEAIWKVEDKWKLTTQEAIILLVFTATLVIVLCTATALKRKKSSTKPNQQEVELEPDMHKKWCGRRSNGDWGSIKRVLMDTVRWSRPHRPPALLGGEKGNQSHDSGSPVWQRPILMGEKCELPKFSGLILYDQRGLPLDPSIKGIANYEVLLQEKTPAAVRTTLRDLL